MQDRDVVKQVWRNVIAIMEKHVYGEEHVEVKIQCTKLHAKNAVNFI